MNRLTVSLTDDTYRKLQSLASVLPCSQSALVEALLARSGMDVLKARADYLSFQNGSLRPVDAPLKRYRGSSIDEIEGQIQLLETDWQGELWDVED